MWGWVCAGLPVAALVGWIFFRSRAYRRHHYSVSVAGGHTSRVVGEMFTLFIFYGSDRNPKRIPWSFKR